MAIKHQMPPSKVPEWDQVIMLVPVTNGTTLLEWGYPYGG